MKNTNKILLFTALIVVLFLSVYSFQLKQQVDNNKVKIDKLASMINSGRATSMQNSHKLEEHNQALQKLNDDYISRKKFDIHPNYIKYKKTITALIDKQIFQIVNEKPLHKGTWILTKIEFLNPEFVYVEYEDGHGLSATFIQIIKTKNSYQFEAIY
ncbi:MAG: hypothetical protein KAJ62_08635 [Desulfobacteraceae bacterium]|nr:hypothetical protein [Desulfobacteraceae bacterium]